MILGHRAPSSFNMSLYRAIWSYLRFILMILVKVLDLILDQVRTGQDGQDGQDGRDGQGRAGQAGGSASLRWNP